MSKIALCLLVLVASVHAAPVHIRTNALINSLDIDTPRPYNPSKDRVENLACSGAEGPKKQKPRSRL